MVTTIRQRASRSRRVAWLIIGGLLLSLSSLVAPGALQAQAAPTMLWGYVLNYNGQFVSGATVTLYTLPAHVAAGPVATTDAQGQWSMNISPGTFAVQATAPGYGFAAQTVYATSTQIGITLILREKGAVSVVPLVATVHGRVTSSDGVPLGGINIIANGRQDTGVRQLPPPPTLSATVTDADGTYTLQVPAGQIWLTLKTGANWGYQLNPMNITSGQTVTGADFVVAMRVLDRSAFPTATAVPVPTPPTPPISNVGPQLGVGMPETGQREDGNLGLVLAVLGLLAVGGGVLARNVHLCS